MSHFSIGFNTKNFSLEHFTLKINYNNSLKNNKSNIILINIELLLYKTIY